MSLVAEDQPGLIPLRIEAHGLSLLQGEGGLATFALVSLSAVPDIQGGSETSAAVPA